MVDKWFITVGSIARSRIYGCSSEPGGEIEAGMVREWVAGKPVWAPCYHGPYLSALAMGSSHNMALYKCPITLLYFTLYPLTKRTKPVSCKILCEQRAGLHTTANARIGGEAKASLVWVKFLTDTVTLRPIIYSAYRYAWVKALKYIWWTMCDTEYVYKITTMQHQ